MIKGDILTQITKNSKDLSLSLILRLALIIFFFFLLNHLNHSYVLGKTIISKCYLTSSLHSQQRNFFPFSPINIIISQALVIYLSINIYCGHKCDTCWLSTHGSNDARHKVSQAPIIWIETEEWISSQQRGKNTETSACVYIIGRTEDTMGIFMINHISTAAILKTTVKLLNLTRTLSGYPKWLEV